MLKKVITCMIGAGVMLVQAEARHMLCERDYDCGGRHPYCYRGEDGEKRCHSTPKWGEKHRHHHGDWDRDGRRGDWGHHRHHRMGECNSDYDCHHRKPHCYRSHKENYKTCHKHPKETKMQRMRDVERNVFEMSVR